MAVAGGEVISHVAGTAGAAHTQARPTLRFAQISDSHIGFQGTANANVTGTFTEAINQVNGLGYTPDFVIHTGDLTHLSTPDQFDQVKQMLTGLNTPHIFTVPGEHDSVDDAGQKYRQVFGAGTRGDGWYSFDTAGVHVIALVNTLNLKKLGHLGTDQLEFIQKDVASLSSDTPIIVFSHIPLFAMYPDWGWGTDDATQALSYLRRFSSVTCLNGHVHQLFTKTEGNITFYSGTTTAYPLPHPGDGPGTQTGHAARRKTARRPGHPCGQLHQGPTRPGAERADTAMNTISRLVVRVGIGATLAVSGVIHAYLYVHGYRSIPTIGPAFLLQASVFCALAVLILAGGPDWLRWAGGVASVAALAAFALSRTVGLFGFTERGWQPSPHAAVSVIAEVLTVALVTASVLNSRSKTAAT